ncbi:MAG: flagellar biosynthetic protein FliO [Myxococcota bacterium]|nr:flagellar biosynthetic protein FliO [Myxococcota bacterium]
MVRLIWATNPIPPPEVPVTTGASFGWMLLWMVLVLFLVVGGMLLLTHFLKRFPGLNQRRGERMEIEETLALTPKAAVHIVNIEGERRLIGTNEGAITHLAHLRAQTQDSSDP